MPYEPALNTTDSMAPDGESKQTTMYWLERATAAAQREGISFIGFILAADGATPFSSHSLESREFAEIVATAAREMITDEETSN